MKKAKRLILLILFFLIILVPTSQAAESKGENKNKADCESTISQATPPLIQQKSLKKRIKKLASKIKKKIRKLRKKASGDYKLFFWILGALLLVGAVFWIASASIWLTILAVVGVLAYFAYLLGLLYYYINNGLSLEWYWWAITTALIIIPVGLTWVFLGTATAGTLALVLLGATLFVVIVVAIIWIIVSIFKAIFNAFKNIFSIFSN